MNKEHPEEEIILDDDEDKDDDFINDYEVDCVGYWQPSRQSRYAEIIEPQWDNEKSYLQLRKQKKVTFEDDIPSTKTNTDPNILTQTIERSKMMKYFEQTVKFIYRVIEDLINNTI